MAITKSTSWIQLKLHTTSIMGESFLLTCDPFPVSNKNQLEIYWTIIPLFPPKPRDTQRLDHLLQKSVQSLEISTNKTQLFCELQNCQVWLRGYGRPIVQYSSGGIDFLVEVMASYTNINLTNVMQK